MKQEMLINVAQAEECRIAIVEDGLLEELYLERSSQSNYVGNIYKGRIVNLEPSIQAAFVDFGVGRNGFLHISDVEPQYFRQGGYDPRKAICRTASIGRDGLMSHVIVISMSATEHDDDDDDGHGGETVAAMAGAVARRRRCATVAVVELLALTRRRAAAVQAADSGYFPARRRSARAGHQRRHRHEGADALDVHQHPGPISGADAGARADRRVAQDRERRRSPTAARYSCAS